MRRIILLIILVWLVTFMMGSEVKNPDRPLKGEWDLKPRKVWKLTEVNGQAFATPGFVVSDDGTLYVSDFKNQSSYIFDSSGHFKRAFAKKGEGPGEVRIHLASFLANDKIVAVDMGSRLHYFSKEGEHIKSLVIDTMNNFPRFFIAEDEYIFATGNMFAIGARTWPDKGDIIRYQLKTGRKKTIAEYVYNDKSTPLPGKQPMRLPTVHSQVITGYDHKNRKLYYGVNDVYRIHVVDLNGIVVNSFSVKRQKQKINREKILEDFKVMHVPGPTKEDIHRFPDELMHFSRILIDEGRVYVLAMNFGSYIDNQAMDIFSLDGKYLYRARFTPGNSAKIYFPMVLNDIVIKKGHLYAVLEDSEGEVSVAKFKLSLPGV